MNNFKFSIVNLRIICTNFFFIVEYCCIRGELMEFFRKYRKAIIAVIAFTFMAWTFGLMLLPLLIEK